jgi:hypothetical protein
MSILRLLSSFSTYRIVAKPNYWILLSILLTTAGSNASNSSTFDFLRLGVVDSWAICVPPKSICSTEDRCRLNETISEITPVPYWVGQSHRDLVERSVIEARNDSLSQKFATYYRYGRVCVDKAGLEWSEAKFSGAEELECFTGYARLGYHPFGTKNGTWFTQIMGLTTTLSHWLDGGNHTLVDGFYVNITKISDRTPVEGQLDLFTSKEDWNRTFELYKMNPALIHKASPRTDQDLYANGFESNCCMNYIKDEGVDKCQRIWFQLQFCNSPNSEPKVTGNSSWPYDSKGTVPPCPDVKIPKASSAHNTIVSGLGLLLVPVVAILWL